MNFLKLIDGNKTYICTIIAAIFTIIHFIITSDYSLSAFIVLSQQSTIIAAIAALRHGIQKVQSGNGGVVTTGTLVAVIIMFLLLCGTSYAQTAPSTTPTVGISNTVGAAIQDVNVPGIIQDLIPKAVNVGYFYNWKDEKVQMTYTYAPLGAMTFSWGAWDYVDIGYASPNVLVGGTALILDIPVLEKKWGITMPSNVQKVLDTMSIGLTPMIGLEEIGGKNRFTGGPGAYIKVTW